LKVHSSWLLQIYTSVIYADLSFITIDIIYGSPAFAMNHQL
jgi:hypothetical protein